VLFMEDKNDLISFDNYSSILDKIKSDFYQVRDIDNFSFFTAIQNVPENVNENLTNNFISMKHENNFEYGHSSLAEYFEEFINKYNPESITVRLNDLLNLAKIRINNDNHSNINTIQNVPENKIENLTKKFILMIYENNFEYGYISLAEEYFEELIKKYNPESVMGWLNGIFLKYFENTKIIIGLLHIIAHLDYKIVYPQGQTMAIAALSYNNIEVRECGIRAFEKWGNMESLKILKNLRCEEKWLSNYVQQIVYDLEEELNRNAITSQENKSC